ncbi:MAG: hypothetical protein OXB84_02775 [Halobacteriovoraceae bacterium]|nr:hypothetical protein [Halobacteriovoraceae bacterium]
MNLLVFAHRNEAWRFLENKKLQPLSFGFPGLYGNGKELLLITKEGRQNCTERLSAVLSFYRAKITTVTNMGIAGALDRQLRPYNIYKVRTCYAQGEFKSFTTAVCDHKELQDCITARERVSDSQKASFLSSFAPLVDRECWAVGSVCALFKIPFYCFKLVSDQANENCLDIANKGKEFSEHLYSFHEKFDYPPAKVIPSFHLNDDFYLTVSQKNHYQALIKKLAIKWQKNEQGTLEKLNLADIAKAAKKPKERTNLLLQRIRENLDFKRE